MANDLFVVDVPRPGEMFHKGVVSEGNRQLLAARQEPRLLSSRELRRARRRLKEITQALQQTDYPKLKSRLEDLNLLYTELGREYKALADTPDNRMLRVKLRKKAQHVRYQQAAMQRKHRELFELESRAKQLRRKLDDHADAMRKEKKREQLRREQEEECYEWHDKIIRTFTRLGYFHDVTKKGKTSRQRVQIERIIVTEDEVQFKVAVSARGLFGWRDLMPYGVRAADLVSEETKEELVAAVQRQVTTHKSELNGYWIFIHRPSAANSVMNYINLQQIVSKRDPKVHDRFPLAMGVSAGRAVQYVYLDTQPHLLVGGETGGGKSNFSNSIICQLIEHYTPNELQLILIDLKEEVEFKAYRDLPHMMMPVVGKLDDAAETLAKLEALRSKRMRQIADSNVLDIGEYNQLHPDNPMPRIVVMIDEYADVLSNKTLGNQVEQWVTQLTAKARAAGINIIISTQNPYASIIPGWIKGNMGARIAFPMSSTNNSRTIIDTGDAARIPRRDKGRAVLKMGDIIEIQTPHVRHEDRDRAIKAAMKHERSAQTQTVLADIDETQDMPAVFNKDTLVKVAVEQLGGNLGARPIYEAIKHDYPSVSHSNVSDMVKSIAYNGTVEYDGDAYEVTKKGTGWIIDMDRKQQLEIA